MGDSLSDRRASAFSSLVEGLAERVNLAKRSGARELEVMSIPPSDFVRGPFGFGGSLAGISAVVFDYCQRRGFRPRVSRSDGKSGFRKIVVPV